jgi:hypothetical protein
MWFAILAILVLLFAGCASPQLVWNKEGANFDDFRRDKYDCVQQSRTSWSGGGSGLIGLTLMASAQSQAQGQANALFRMCMEARGYTAHAKQEGETVHPGVSQPKERQPLPPPQPVASPPSVPQRVEQPSVTPPAFVPQPVPQQGERQLVETRPPQERTATFDVVQLQSRYNASRLFLRPDTGAERLSMVSSAINLKVIENRGSWLYIETPDERRGWVLREWIQE